MSNLAHANDCLTYLYYRSGDSTSSPNFAANALLYLNLAYRELYSGTCRLMPQMVAAFPWAKAAQPKTIILQPVSTGTAAIVQGSASITFSSGPAASKVGYHIKFGTEETYYRVDSHIAASTSATLDSVTMNATNAAIAYTLFKIDYTVGSSDIIRLIDMFSTASDTSLGNGTYKLIPEDEMGFRRYFPTFSSGMPTHFCLLAESAGTFTIRFNKYLAANTYRRLEAPYIPIADDLTASDLSIPIVPKQHRQTLCDLATFYLQSDTNDDRAQVSFQLAAQGYASMLKEIGMKDITFMPFKVNEEVKLGV